MRGRVLPIVMVLLMCASSAMAAGFRLPEAGAKAMGMGFAFTAQADDPSAIYFNPAGLTQLEGNNVMFGVTYIKENGAEFTGSTPLTGGAVVTETQKDLNFFVPNAYYTRKASKGFAWGVGMYTPFGLGQEYKDAINGIFRNQVNKVEIMTFVVNPTIAWDITDAFSVGFGIDYMYGSANLNQTVFSPLAGNLQILDLDGDGDAWGYNFGMLLKASKSIKIGFNYRSPFDLEIKDADVNTTDLPGTPNPIPNTTASTTIKMPATAALGVSYTGGRFTFEADADFTMWSRFDTLVIDFAAPGLPNSVRPQNWNDVVAIRLGAEYRITDPLALRLGFAYDPTPVPAETMSPLLPDSDRFNYMVGAGYKAGAWTFDLSYFYVDKEDRTVSNITNLTNPAQPRFFEGFNGTWKGDAHLVALDIGYRF